MFEAQIRNGIELLDAAYASEKNAEWEVRAGMLVCVDFNKDDSLSRHIFPNISYNWKDSLRFLGVEPTRENLLNIGFLAPEGQADVLHEEWKQALKARRKRRAMRNALRGAALLDIFHAGWVAKIDLSQFKMDGCHPNVPILLGYGSDGGINSDLKAIEKEFGLQKMTTWHVNTEERSFVFYGFGVWVDHAKELGEAWKEIIQERQALVSA